MDVSLFIAHFFTQFEYLRNSVGIVIIAVASLLVCPFPKFSIFTNPYCSRSDIILRLQSPQLVRTPCLDPSLYHLHYNTRGWWKTPYQSTSSGTCHSYHDFKLCFDCCWVRHHLRAVKLGLYELLQT